MMHFVNNPRRFAALKAWILLLFLPAHLAFVLLIDLNFIPQAASTTPLTLQEDENSGPDKERLRVQLLKPSDSRISPLDGKYTFVFRALDPWGLPCHVRPVLTAGEAVAAALTKPASLRIWLAATPHNHRAPPA